jgi:hypothetical protein
LIPGKGKYFSSHSLQIVSGVEAATLSEEIRGHSASYNAEIKNTWSFTYYFPYILMMLD